MICELSPVSEAVLVLWVEKEVHSTCVSISLLLLLGIERCGVILKYAFVLDKVPDGQALCGSFDKTR